MHKRMRRGVLALQDPVRVLRGFWQRASPEARCRFERATSASLGFVPTITPTRPP
jgi:hypothetical protein